MSAQRFYVYHLIDPRDGRAFYVGKGTGSRIRAHEVEAHKGLASKKCDKIREIWRAELPVERRIVRLFETSREALTFELAEIDRIGLANLTNICRPPPPRPWSMKITESNIARLAFMLKATDGLRRDVAFHFEYSDHSVFRKALSAAANSYGIRRLASEIVAMIVRTRGIKFLNEKLSGYGIVMDDGCAT